MRRSKGVIISIKVPIRWNHMTKRQKTRLSQITGRDTRVIKAYLGVIERYESQLLTGKRENRINPGMLDKLTLTTTRHTLNRSSVPHDFKARFPNISFNEFQECRDTAIAMWNSYLKRQGSKPLHAKGYTSRKIPRIVFKRRFDIIYTPDKSIKHWLCLLDSLDSTRHFRTRHDKLTIPLAPSSYHINKMSGGELGSLRILKDKFRKWWAIFTINLNIEQIDTDDKPPAVLAIDLGIKKAACSILLTQKGYKQVHYWKLEDKLQLMRKYNNTIASLQKRKEKHISEGREVNGIIRKLRKVSRKLSNISTEYDKKFVRSLSDHILEMTKDYDIFVAIGKLRGIRNTARKGSFKGRTFRGMIHRWSFARISDCLKHKLASLGLSKKKFLTVPESWTSIQCHKCGNKGIRPTQNLFICHTCGYRNNADLNGAINIGKRVIMLIPSLKDEKTGLGMWLLPSEKTTLKARRSTRSNGKSLLSQRLPKQSKGESVADCYDQTSLETFVSSEDPAMEKTVKIPSATGISGSSSVQMQRTETRSRKRGDVPVKSGKAHVIVCDQSHMRAGDSSRETGGTQKLLAVSSLTKIL